MTKKNQSLELVKEDITRKAVEDAAAGSSEVKQAEALMYLGGIGAIRSLTDKLAAQTVRALEAFGESKAYEMLGYTTFVDFLNQSPYSPMTKSQYYDRLGALAAEGDAAYDLLNNLGVPLSKRKLLSDGAVQLDGDTLVVGGERVPLNDRGRVVEAIKTLAETNQQQARKIEKGTEQNKKLKQERDDLKKRGGAAGALDEYDATLVQLLGLYANLVSLAFELKDPQRLEKRDYTFARLADQRLQLEEALGVHAPSNGNGEHGLADQDIDELADTF